MNYEEYTLQYLEKAKKFQEESSKRIQSVIKEYAQLQKLMKEQEQARIIKEKKKKEAKYEFIIEVAHRALHGVGMCIDDIDIVLEFGMDQDVLKRLEDILELHKDHGEDEVLTKIAKEKVISMTQSTTILSMENVE